MLPLMTASFISFIYCIELVERGVCLVKSKCIISVHKTVYILTELDVNKMAAWRQE